MDPELSGRNGVDGCSHMWDDREFSHVSARSIKTNKNCCIKWRSMHSCDSRALERVHDVYGCIDMFVVTCSDRSCCSAVQISRIMPQDTGMKACSCKGMQGELAKSDACERTIYIPYYRYPLRPLRLPRLTLVEGPGQSFAPLQRSKAGAEVAGQSKT